LWSISISLELQYFLGTQHGTCTTNNLDYALGRNGPKASFPAECAGTTMRIPFVEGVFEAVQFHMHIGSEHTIGGQRWVRDIGNSYSGLYFDAVLTSNFNLLQV
jgi:hypothetical protein